MTSTVIFNACAWCEALPAPAPVLDQAGGSAQTTVIARATAIRRSTRHIIVPVWILNMIPL
jgi:hypothetical protein